ncbi:hypothetical protein SJ05684_c11560 [Sinorhizobium sojae CCBAU 05684]|uniref:Uncharacterized protein n=1 Tax=Sinorhizobium sojae CCBAU 05684 TaxID=716928 RepID=A0A249PA37_9HYPH|nr:hypothetical protein [Sinorhizobium sojae]ASY62612.1 hypothetical protein SJ05684_c11560 [Sinorhizobium sojae CCBAU 05684]
MTVKTYTFAATVRIYIEQFPTRRHNRSADQDARFHERYLLDPASNPILEKPIADVTDGELMRFLFSLRGRPALARSCTQKIRAFFVWAMQPERREVFGLRSNPALYILPRYIAGPIRPRDRHLDDEELHAYLAAAETLEPPQRALAEALALTGQLPSKLGRMRWTELDLGRKIWRAPKEGAHPVVIALSDVFASRLADMRANLPADAGDFVFSATQGRTPLVHLERMRSALGRRMSSSLGHTPDSPTPTWLWMDLRRTVINMLLEDGSLPFHDALRAVGSNAPDLRAPKWRWVAPPRCDTKTIRDALDRHAAALDEIMRKGPGGSGSASHSAA